MDIDYRNNLIVELVERANRVPDDAEKYTAEQCAKPTKETVEGPF